MSNDPFTLRWKTVRSNQGEMLVMQYRDERQQQNQSSYPTNTAPLKIAAIDLNNTLITPKSGRPHGISGSDWKWWHPSVPSRLRHLASPEGGGYTIILHSNQGRLTDFPPLSSSDASTAPAVAEPFKTLAGNVIRALGIRPMTLFVTYADDLYRKPRTGVWSGGGGGGGGGYGMLELMGMEAWEGMGIDLEQSFVVGDQAGRGKDRSDVDLHLSMNLGVGFFYTPEAFFLGEEMRYNDGRHKGGVGHKFDPEEWLVPRNMDPQLGSSSQTSNPLFPLTSSPQLDGTQSVILLVGLPGAGKTYYYDTVLRPMGFERADGRLCGSMDEYFMYVGMQLALGQSVVIDDLNLNAETRQLWIQLCRNHHGVPVSALYFPAPVNLCLHNEAARAFGGPLMNKEQRTVLPRAEFLSLVSKLKKPKTSEGFQAIADVQFQWMGTDEEMAIWRQYWI